MNKIEIRSLFNQLFRFASVGLLAAFVHFAIVLLLVQTFFWQPLIANVVAFSVAFQVNYLGHRYITFKDATTSHKLAFTRLLLVQTVNFIANEALFSLLLALHLPYQFALLIVLAILPAFTFIANKLWVFA